MVALEVKSKHYKIYQVLSSGENAIQGVPAHWSHSSL